MSFKQAASHVFIPSVIQTFKTGLFCFQVRKLCIDSSHRLSYISNADPNGNFNSRKFNCCNFWSEYACRTEIDKLFYENLLLYSYQRVRQHQSYEMKTVWTVNNFHYRNDNLKWTHIQISKNLHFKLILVARKKFRC